MENVTFPYIDGHSATRITNGSSRETQVERVLGVSMDKNRLFRQMAPKKNRLPSMQPGRGLNITAEAVIGHD